MCIINKHKIKSYTMKEHVLAIVFLGLLFLTFRSPFPNRLLETETTIQEIEIQFPQDNDLEYMLYEIEDANKDTLILSPGAAAFLEGY